MKRLIAYSSVSHLGFCMLGIFALNRVAVQGGTLQMINHGLSTGGLFALVGMMYERYHTRRIADFGGIAREVPGARLLHGLHDAGQHRTAGAERLRGRVPAAAGHVPAGVGYGRGRVDAHYRVISVLAVSGVVLGAWYMLSLVKRVFFGPLNERKQLAAIPT